MYILLFSNRKINSGIILFSLKFEKRNNGIFCDINFTFLHFEMAVSAKYASLYDTMVDDTGKQYIAKLCNGVMTWVLTENSGCPVISASVMSVGDVLIGTDKQEYIVTISNNMKHWSLKTSNSKKQKKQKDQTGNLNGCPVISPSIMNIGDIVKGTDGNEYIVQNINGQKQYIIHQKVYKWSKSGALYKTLDYSTMADNGNCQNSRQKSRSKTKM
jgi:hypothetical protein